MKQSSIDCLFCSCCTYVVARTQLVYYAARKDRFVIPFTKTRSYRKLVRQSTVPFFRTLSRCNIYERGLHIRAIAFKQSVSGGPLHITRSTGHNASRRSCLRCTRTRECSRIRPYKVISGWRGHAWPCHAHIQLLFRAQLSRWLSPVG